jgi:hypothetical protein
VTEAGDDARATGTSPDIGKACRRAIIDQRGILRVQYLGVRFDPDEFRRDLEGLLKEEAAR